MNKVWWVLFILALDGLAAWIVVGPRYPQNSVAIFLVCVFFAAPNLGTLWMWYRAVQHEKQGGKFVLLGFIPFSLFGTPSSACGRAK